MATVTAAQMAFTFGILGNIVSFLVFLAPVPTFCKIYKKKSTEEFQSIPYSVALFSAMLYLYYAFLKKNVIMLITINSVGCAFEVVFLTIFMVYATNQSKIFTTKLLILFNIGTLGLIIGCTYFLSEGHTRVTIVGWICSAFSVCVFGAPLSIMRQVIKTKSVEYMPLSLSLFLTLCAIVWFFYGLFIKDYYIALLYQKILTEEIDIHSHARRFRVNKKIQKKVGLHIAPNVVGFILGISQAILYAIYRKREQQIILPEIKLHDISTINDRKSQDRVQNPSKVEIVEITDLKPNEDIIIEYVAKNELIVY